MAKGKTGTRENTLVCHLPFFFFFFGPGQFFVFAEKRVRLRKGKLIPLFNSKGFLHPNVRAKKKSKSFVSKFS